MLQTVQAKDIDKTWDICAPMLKKALRKENPLTLEEYKDGLKRGTHQLWVWVEKNKILCSAITCIVNYPSKKFCSVPLVGGAALKMWKEPAIEIIAGWAKSLGCSDMEGYALRKGWLRVLPKWRPVWTTIHRSL